MNEATSIDVVAAVIHAKGNVLIARRAPGKHLAGYWEFPGGKVEDKEDPANSLSREIREELGLEISVGALIAKNTHLYDEKSIILSAYHVTKYSGEIRLVDHDKYEWVPILNLKSYQLAPADIPLISPIEKFFSF